MKSVYVLDEVYPEISNLVREVRDKKNMGYNLWEKVFELGRAEGQIMADIGIAKENPVLVYVLRAGEPLLLGANSIYKSRNRGFIAAKRDERTLKSEAPYIAMPDIDGADVIVADSMVATGGSDITALEILEGYGTPKTITVAAAISSEYGIREILKKYGDNVPIFTGTMAREVIPGGIGPGLNNRGYILNPEGAPRDLGDDMFGNARKEH